MTPNASSRNIGRRVFEQDTVRCRSVSDEKNDLFADKNKEGFFCKVGQIWRDFTSYLAKWVADLWNKIFKRSLPKNISPANSLGDISPLTNSSGGTTPTNSPGNISTTSSSCNTTPTNSPEDASAYCWKYSRCK